MQVLRELVAGVPAAALAAELGPGAADVAELLPELRRRLPRLPRPDDMGSDQARFRVFESVTALLGRAAARDPLAVALDDLHWGDADSLRLLDFVAAARRTMPLLLLGAYRDVEVRRDRPLARLLGALAGRTNVERFELRGLDREAVMELVTAVAGEPRPDVSAALAERTAGNPFFVRELLRLLDDEGRLAAGAEALSELALPQGVRDAVGRRLDRLSPACNDVLRAAAVAGRSFDLRVLATLVETPREALLELLAEAQAAGILVETPESGPARVLARVDRPVAARRAVPAASCRAAPPRRRGAGEPVRWTLGRASGGDRTPLLRVVDRWRRRTSGGLVRARGRPRPRALCL